MSGICGAVRLDQQPARAEEIAGVLRALGRRGRDGSHCVVSASAVLGHALLATTPEALRERLPFAHAMSGCAITADARIDNREEVAGQLTLARSLGETGDGELILQAYLRWGTQCVARLLGDFAFAIWDPREQRLFAARDQTGMRQLVYHHQPGRLFAWASDAQALLAHNDVPFEINEGRLGDFFENLEACDFSSTFFTGLSRLPPAHALIVDRSNFRRWRYWSAECPPLLQLPSDEAYAEAFLDVFTRAVRSRTRSPGPIGAMLSGGMDSSSAAGVAACLLKKEGKDPLQTFSAIRKDPDCVESNAIRAAMGIEHIAPHLLALDELEGLVEEVMQQTLESGEPFDGHMTLVRAVYVAARRRGIKVMLDGGGGDTTLVSEIMPSLYLRQGKVLRAWREARGERAFWGAVQEPMIDHFRRVIRNLAPESLRAKRHASYRLRMLQEASRRSPLSIGFAQRIKMAERRERNADHLQVPESGDARRIMRTLHPHTVLGRERYDRVASQSGIEPRDPFFDRRVIAFCLSLPDAQLQHDGWPKTILRRAMKGILPDAVRWRIGKQHLGSEFGKVLDPGHDALFDHDEIGRLSEFLSPNAFVSGACLQQNEMEGQDFARLRYAERWLKYANSDSFRVPGDPLIP